VDIFEPGINRGKNYDSDEKVSYLPVFPYLCRPKVKSLGFYSFPTRPHKFPEFRNASRE